MIDFAAQFRGGEESLKDPFLLFAEVDKEKLADPSYVENFIDSIEAMSHNQALKMLELIECSEHAQDFPRDITDVLCEKIFKGIRGRSMPENDPDWGHAARQNLLELYIDVVHGELEMDKAVKVIDKIFAAIPSLSSEYPDLVYEFLNIVGQDHVVSPDIFVSAMIEIINDPHSEKELKEAFLHNFIYQRQQSPQSFDDVFLARLDFEDKSNFSKTAHMLDFLSKINNVSRDVGWIRDGNAPLFQKISNEVEEGKGSYLLNLRARILLEQIKSGGPVLEVDKLPVLISGKRYMLNGELSKEGDAEKIEDLIKQFEASKTDIKMQLQIFEEIEIYFDNGDPVWQEVGINQKDGYEAYLYMTDEQADYTWLISKPIRTVIEKEFNFKLSDLSFDEQFYFLNFLKDKKARGVPKVQDFVKTFGSAGFRTFLSLEYGDDFGDKIIDFGNNNLDIAHIVFEKYANLIDEVRKVAQQIRNELLRGEYGKQRDVVGKVSDSLTYRGRKLLESFALKQIDPKDIDRLEHMNEDVVAYGVLVKALKGTGINFEDIVGTSLLTKRGGDFNEEEKGAMLYAFNKNREGNDPKVMSDISRALFEKTLSNKDSEFRILYLGETPITFMRFEKKEDGSVYAGSLNTAPELKGNDVAIQFVINELKEENKEADVVAEVWTGRPLTFYKKRCGFEEEGEIENWNDTGERFVKLRIPKGKLQTMAENTEKIA